MPRCGRLPPLSTLAPNAASATPVSRHPVRSGPVEPGSGAPRSRRVRSIRRRVLGAAAACLAVLGLPAAGEAQEWRYNAKVYGWLPALSVTLGTPLGDVDVDQSRSDVLDQLDFAIFGTFEAQSGRWSLIGDLAHSKLSDTRTLLPSAPFDGVQIDTRLTAISAYGAYRVIQTETVGIDLAAGLRYYDLSLSATLSGPSLGISRGDSWTDPVIGARAVFTSGGDWRGAVSLDAGGFGIGRASDFSWQATAEVEYAFSDRWSGLLGYRHLSIDRPAEGRARKLDLSGPVIGVRARF